ncbi:MAG: c-type cytochrome [Gammaproteobacteria bacterium]|nr:c-type cytochrome [Gammaproteobacteria bacterium]
MSSQTLVLQLRKLSALLVASGLLLSLNIAAANAADDPARGEKLSQTCLGCHGAPGLRNPGPVYNIPMIGGQHKDYIVVSLKAYKDKSRSHGTMQAQAANLSDQDMADIGAFFAAMDGNSRPSNVNAAKAAAGQQESAVCQACHGATGDGDNTIYPKLSGQYESYLVQALKDYRSGARQNAIMAGFAGPLSIDQIEKLAAWFASQQGGLSAPQSEIFK